MKWVPVYFHLMEKRRKKFSKIFWTKVRIFSLVSFSFLWLFKSDIFFFFWRFADLDWPESDEMSDNMRQTIDSLLTLNPEERSNGYDLRKQSLFQNIQWDNLLSVEPPFVPQPDSEYDTSYFKGKYNYFFLLALHR